MNFVKIGSLAYFNGVSEFLLVLFPIYLAVWVYFAVADLHGMPLS